MVVNDLDLPGVASAPDKTDTPLVVYTQAIGSSNLWATAKEFGKDA